jgi:hypothetical protein
MEQISGHIKNVVSMLGNETDSNISVMSRSQLEQISNNLGKSTSKTDLQAIGKLKQMLDLGQDYYKITNKTESERNHLDKALNYIWGTLDVRSQNKLSATAKINGMKDPKELIVQALQFGSDYSSTYASIPSEDADGKGSSSSKAGESPVTPFELLHQGKLGKQLVPWNDPTTGKTFTLTATGQAKLANMDGKPLGPTTLYNVLQSENGLLLNSKDAYFGDKKISMSDLNNIVYDGENALRVYMPTNSQGAPDYNKLTQFQQLEKELLGNKNLTPEQINDAFEQNGFSYVQVDNQKQYIMNNNFKPFLLMTGYTAEDAQSVGGNSKIKALSGDEKGEVVEGLKGV